MLGAFRVYFLREKKDSNRENLRQTAHSGDSSNMSGVLGEETD